MASSAVVGPEGNIQYHEKYANQMESTHVSCLESETSSTHDPTMVSDRHISAHSFQSSSASSRIYDWRTPSMSSFRSESSLFSTPSLRFLDVGSSFRRSGISSIKSHGGASIFSLALMGRGSSTVLYSGSHGIQAWHHDAQYSVKHNYNFGSGAVKAICFAGDKILSAHEDHKIRVWKYSDTHYPKHACTLPTMKDYLRKCVRPENYIKVRRHKSCLWIQHIDTISSLATTKDGLMLYSASWDRTVKVWRLSDCVCVDSFQAHVDAINSIAVSDDGILYTASADSKIKVWKKCSKGKGIKHTMIRTLEKHKSAINALALSSDCSVLYSGGCDKVIIVWERQERVDNGGGDDDGENVMHAVGFLSGHMQAILCLDSVNSDVVCSGSADKTVRIWRRKVGDCQSCCLAILNGHNSPVKSITACYDKFMGCVVFSGSLDGEIRAWLGHDHIKLLNFVGL